MVKKVRLGRTTVYVCGECGYGYADKPTAERCEEYCSTHMSCSLEITRNAIYVPRSES